MKLFISWSGERSQKVAEVVKEWVQTLFPKGIDVWLSSENMIPGRLSMPKIIKALKTSDYGIFCFVKDNCKSSWMMFEAGAISKQSDAAEAEGLYGIIFDGTIEDFRRTPFEQLQLTVFDKKSLDKMFKSINTKMGQAKIEEHILSKNVDTTWSIYCVKIKEALGDCSVGGKAVNKEQLMAQLAETDFGKPHLGQMTFYEKGFEDYPLYDILLKNTSKRLWILGRKNRKLFDQRNKNCFENLKNRIKEGFDFRCLFLDPNSSAEILTTAQDTLDFPIKLKISIRSAFDIAQKAGIEPSSIFRLYSAVREYAVIIADDVVLFSPILYRKQTDKTANKQNAPEHLTKAAFNLLSINEEIAKFHLNQFDNIWKKATLLSVPPKLK